VVGWSEYPRAVSAADQLAGCGAGSSSMERSQRSGGGHSTTDKQVAEAFGHVLHSGPVSAQPATRIVPQLRVIGRQGNSPLTRRVRLPWPPSRNADQLLTA
jgi:hypothetical protein